MTGGGAAVLPSGAASAPPGALPEPPGPRGLPFAHLPAFRRDPLRFLERLHATYGDVVHFRFGPRRLYLVAHPDQVRDVLVTNHRNFIKSRALQRARVILGQGLLTSEGELHLRQADGAARLPPRAHRRAGGDDGGVRRARGWRLAPRGIWTWRGR